MLHNKCNNLFGYNLYLLSTKKTTRATYQFQIRRLEVGNSVRGIK